MSDAMMSENKSSLGMQHMPMGLASENDKVW